MKRKLLRCMTALSAVLFASCTSELALEDVPQAGVDGEEVEVTFSISPESNHVTMRDAGVGGPGQWQTYIGRGKNIDMLIYAVYEQDTITKDYTLLHQYGQGIDSKLSSAKAIEETTHDGQTVLDVSNTIQQGEAESITLRLMRNKTYHIAFWAQSSETTAYNTEDLEKVAVDYTDALNNDETRDAFCKVESFSVSANSPTREVILTRPFAQINVGGKDISKTGYTQSKIVLTGVSDSINVVEDKISEATAKSVTFKLNNLDDFKKEDEEGTLKINIDDKKNDNGDIVPDEYTYLSMCYALVPTKTTTEGVAVPDYASSVLSKVEFYVNRDDDNGKIFEITSVPVHRNWRTNILWNDTTATPPNPDDDDDDDPDNPTPTIIVGLDTGYDGDYNGYEDTTGNQWHEWPVTGATGN